jgi:hypothetical protein
MGLSSLLCCRYSNRIVNNLVSLTRKIGMKDADHSIYVSIAVNPSMVRRFSLSRESCAYNLISRAPSKYISVYVYSFHTTDIYSLFRCLTIR